MLGFLLPWEKMPPIVLGPLLMLIGGILFFHVPNSSWDQFKAGAMFFVGIGLFIHGIKKVAVETEHVNSAALQSDTAKRIADESAPPDYAKYTEAQLCQVHRRIDREKFPERVAEIESRLRGFEAGRL